MVQNFNNFNSNFPVNNYYGTPFAPVAARSLGFTTPKKPINQPVLDYYDGEKPKSKAPKVILFLATVAAIVGITLLVNSNAAKKALNSLSSTSNPAPAPKKPPKPAPKPAPSGTPKPKPVKKPPKAPSGAQTPPVKPKQNPQKSGFNVRRRSPRTPQTLANKAIQGILSSENITNSDLRRIETIFKDNTGLNLYCADALNIKDFDSFFDLIFSGKFYQRIDSDIKHIIVGHGMGSAADGTWRFMGNGRDVFDFIERKIPRGEKVLLITCETAANSPRPGIGTAVNVPLLDRAKPGKVVESGRRAIIGTLTQYHPKIEYF